MHFIGCANLHVPNGKGKTTFANLLLGKYEYRGSISAPGIIFDYFPYAVNEADLWKTASELLESWKTGVEEWKVICELSKLGTDAEILYRSFCTLSHGERAKVMLAVLFSGENDFLIIDEPTNHMDMEARETVKKYLSGKKGFILISHDRDLLDAVVDHCLVLNRKSIEVCAGNFSTWWENKQRKDAFSEHENEKHMKEIDGLKKCADRVSGWADKSEGTKIGFDPIQEHDRCKSTRSYIAAKTKKMQARVKSFETRIQREIEEKEGLLEDIEKTVDLKLMPEKFHKETLVYAKDYSFRYSTAECDILHGLNLEIQQGERVFLHGRNGCGKSTLIKQILASKGVIIASGLGSIPEENAEANGSVCAIKAMDAAAEPITSGELRAGSGLIISYINQDTSGLCGSLKEYCRLNGLDESLLLALLRQLGLERIQFEKNMETYSEGQKKKVLIAASLITKAHLYIWDEPLNYIDVFSRMQIEELILKYQPTMLIVDHDIRFREKVGTRVFEDFRS